MTGRVIEEGGKCLSSQSTPFINSIPSVPPQNYVFLQRNVRVAQALCNNYQNFTACQLLGNLCVLHMYNTDNFDNLLTIATDPCKEFLKLQREYKGEFNGHLDWPVSMPWLYYTSVTSTEVIYKTDLTSIFLRGNFNVSIFFYFFNIALTYVAFFLDKCFYNIYQGWPD